MPLSEYAGAGSLAPTEGKELFLPCLLLQYKEEFSGDHLHFSSETVGINKDSGTLGLTTQFSTFSRAGQNISVKEELMKWRLSQPGLGPAQYQHKSPPPPHGGSWEINSFLQGEKQQSIEDQRAEEGQGFFIFPKHHFYNFASCYHGYHRTFELISTETAIAA